ncbi:hypothetical protein [Variovorax sp. CY25R-8]|uniref:hypothetical protein n=1 Tax=Variovorax sp. CY25R-8 TaxID=2855501 RepID=UPI0021BAB1D8|nr:hypothetical protein [Variovorax sp. CY25R-8]MCT8174973.1 hypothetical protein [Variovorax sp. CY25R-8]
MRSIGLALALLCAGSTHAQEKSPREVLQLVESHCRLRLAPAFNDGLSAAHVDRREVDGRRYGSFLLESRVPDTSGSPRTVQTRLSCALDAPATALPLEPTSPRELLAMEDAGGRYFRHVAWQRRINGPRWTGQWALIDSLQGDGARSAINAYLMCFTSRSNICIHMELQNPALARNAQNTLVEGLFKGIRILD